MNAGWIAAAALAVVAGFLGWALIVARRRLAWTERRLEQQRASVGSSRSALDEARADTAMRERILQALDEGVLLAAGREVVYANPAASRLLGGPPRVLPPWVRVPAGNEPATGSITLHHPHRREVRSVTAALDGDAVLVVLKDVTDERRLEGARRDLVANASHEMKTPLAAILATAESLVPAIEDDPALARRFAGTLVREARGLSSLLQNLLDLARLDHPTSTPQEVDLARIVEEQVATMRPRADEAGVRVTASVESFVRVAGSADDLALLVRNLLDNAIRYTPAGGHVGIRLESSANEVRLEVRDTGIGIPSRDLPRIFERFYRVDEARARATGGTGLGLAIVHAVAEAHGAEVGADSELGSGSTFTVRFSPATP